MAKMSILVINLAGLVLLSTAYSQMVTSVNTMTTACDTSTAFVGGASLSPGKTTPTTYRAIPTLPASVDAGQNVLPNIYDPQAVDAQSVCPGYTASKVTRTSYGLTAALTLAGTPCNVYGNDVVDLVLTVEYQATDRLHIEITPTYIGSANSSWFVLPEELIPKPGIEAGSSPDNDLEFVWSNTPSFSFKVLRQATGDVLFSTAGTKLVYEDQFIEFVSTLPENYNLYGLGEVIHGLRLGNNLTRTFYAADVADPVDTNLYGTHPFYLDTRYFEKDPKTGAYSYVANATDPEGEYVSFTHGAFLRNTHGQEVLLQPSNITWRTLGGNIDLYLYSGPTQKEVTAAYQFSTVGLPVMQQYFTFGYHQCRWGYANWTELQDVVDNMAAFGLPLENIWSDIDYMNQYRDFENDENTYSYAEAAIFLSDLHQNGQHYIPIVDSAVYIPNSLNASDAYPVFDRGNASDSFMLNPDGSLYIGAVWPGFTVFPDWVGATMAGTGANEWWTSELVDWYKNIAFDGIWIDMSEVSSFCVGSCGTGKLAMNPVHPPFGLPGEPGNVIYSYPEGFALTNASEAAAASAASSSEAASASSMASVMSASAAMSMTAAQTQITSVAGEPMAPTPTSMSYLRTTPTPGARNVNYPPYVINNVQGDLAVHAMSPNATHHGGIVEYDVHNIFGHQILNATYNALLEVFPTKRPFIIGRSTFAGSGKWAGHWGGDNYSQFFYMMMSIPQALSFSLFGIPMFGVDTCGFNGNSDEELCNRWMQLSAFFPFYRNHNVLSAISQEPYVWASVAAATKTAVTIRYLLLPYIYTTFFLAHSTGSTVMRALAWEFPNDPMLASADRQFLLGGSLMVTPVLNQGYTTVSGVFPGVAAGEVWYDWYNQSAITVKQGENVTIDAPLGHIPLYLRGGSVLPTQEPGMTTTECRKNPWGLITALSASGTASGNLYIDDGQSLTPNATLFVEFSVTNSTLYTSARGTYVDMNALANVTILGVQTAPKSVILDDQPLSSKTWTYDSSSKVLSVTGLNGVTAAGAWTRDWYLSWAS